MASAAFELPTSTKGYSDILARNIDYAEDIMKYFCKIIIEMKACDPEKVLRSLLSD